MRLLKLVPQYIRKQSELGLKQNDNKIVSYNKEFLGSLGIGIGLIKTLKV